MKKLLSALLVLAVTLILTGCELEGTVTAQVSFYLHGDNIVELEVGEDFEDPGFNATAAGNDLSSSVSVLGLVVVNEPGVYQLQYKLVYEGSTYEIYRFIIVNDNYANIDFRLLGEVQLEVGIGDEYLDEGFISTMGEIDLVTYVTVTGAVDEDTPGLYFLQYDLVYETTEISLLRAVTVIGDAFQDPDEVLYDGTCDNVEVHFLDLDAMGDSTLIDCGDFEIVIDAGTSGVGRDLVTPYLEDFVTDGVIELAIATHPDSDHFGGFIKTGVFGSFDIERVLDFGYEKDTLVYDDYIIARDLTDALVCSGSEALAGTDMCQSYYTITEDLILRVIDTGNYDGQDGNHNENSIVVMLEHGDVNFLFTGDAEFEAEGHMAPTIGHVDIYKAGHHGSKTANSQVFLNALTPDTIILSAHFYDGNDDENQYGIPQQESVDRLFGSTDDIYATGTNGHIVITSNGTTYAVVGSIDSILFKDSTWFSTHRTYPTE